MCRLLQRFGAFSPEPLGYLYLADCRRNFSFLKGKTCGFKPPDKYRHNSDGVKLQLK
ncbi:MAG TPA: hypothetical protein GXX20_04795 [Clostridiaceae bacterium]|nr:hypothetical protein [Clostridiaceae bacterium]